jgi:hypothetical protein
VAPDPGEKDAKLHACSATEPVVLEEAPATSVAVAVEDGWGFVVIDGERAARVIPIDEDGARAGPSRDVELSGSPFALRAVGEWRVLAAGEPSYGEIVLHARALGREQAGPPARLALAWMNEALGAAASDERLALAHRDRQGQIRLALFDVNADGSLEASSADVGTPEHPAAELLALAVSGREHAVLYRAPRGERIEGPVVLETARGTAVVEALHEAIAVEGFARKDDGTLAAIATFEHDPTALFSFREDGAAVAAPVSIASGAPVPEPFAGRLRATVGGAPDELVVHVETLAGHAVGSSLTIARTEQGPLLADVTRAGDGFVVAVLDVGARTVATSTITCSLP